MGQQICLIKGDVLHKSRTNAENQNKEQAIVTKKVKPWDTTDRFPLSQFRPIITSGITSHTSVDSTLVGSDQTSSTYYYRQVDA